MGINISLKNSSFIFLNNCAPLTFSLSAISRIDNVFYLSPDIFLFWKTSIIIITFVIQKVLQTLTKGKCLIESSLLTSFPSMILTPPFLHIVPQAFDIFLTFPLLLPLLLSPCSREMLHNLISEHSGFLLLALCLHSSSLLSVLLPSIYKKFFEMTLLCMLLHTVPSPGEYFFYFIASAAALFFLFGNECGQIFYFFWLRQMRISSL